MKKILLIIGIVICSGAFAVGDKTITSKNYVDTQLATKQDTIPAVDTNTVLTHTGVNGNIGEKAIYDSNESYESQQTALMTAGDANAGINNALENEFVCVDADTDGTCLIWEIRPARLSQLPDTYTQLEYLESNGTQYIDTGVIPTNTTGVKIKYNKYVSGDQVVVGVDTEPGRFYINPAQNLFLPFNEGWSEVGSSGPTVLNTDYEVSMNYMNNRKRYVNGIEKQNITHTLGQSKKMFLFAANYNGNGANWKFSGKVYYLKITNGSQITHDFIPARRNSDGKLGMYDLVSNTFFTNQGSGTFVAGPVASYIPQGQ